MRDWKAIPKQTLLVENGEFGDCWRCCIAAIIGREATNLPHWMRDAEHAEADTQRWLKERGWIMIEAAKMWVPQWHGDSHYWPFIVYGPTVRSKTSRDTHAVVKLGQEIVYDPHPSEAGLLAELGMYAIFSIGLPPGVRYGP